MFSFSSLAPYNSFLTAIDQQYKVLSQTATPHFIEMQQKFSLSNTLRTQLQMCQKNGGLCQTAKPIGQELYPNADDQFSNQLKSTTKR